MLETLSLLTFTPINIFIVYILSCIPLYCMHMLQLFQTQFCICLAVNYLYSLYGSWVVNMTRLTGSELSSKMLWKKGAKILWEGLRKGVSFRERKGNEACRGGSLCLSYSFYLRFLYIYNSIFYKLYYVIYIYIYIKNIAYSYDTEGV